MRELARFDAENQASVLADALFVEGIGTTINQAREGHFVVWVHDEADLEEAKQILDMYTANPDAEHFAIFSRRAHELRKKRENERSKDRFRSVKVRERWSTRFGAGRLTLGIICASVVVTFLTEFGHQPAISRYVFMVDPQFGGPAWWNLLESLKKGQVWRFVTPIFVHLGILHLIFNMWWLKDLGTLVESKQGAWFLALLVLSIGVGSNVAQFWFDRTPIFGGMSGVIYGLFGYAWARGRLDPLSGYALPPNVAFWLMGWFVICLTGLVGPVANTTHAAGLVLGGAWGWVFSQLSRRR